MVNWKNLVRMLLCWLPVSLVFQLGAAGAGVSKDVSFVLACCLAFVFGIAWPSKYSLTK